MIALIASAFFFSSVKGQGILWRQPKSPIESKCLLANHITSESRAILDDSLLSAATTSISIHRNGEANSCGDVSTNLSALTDAFSESSYCPDAVDNKYELESFLTNWFATQLGEGTCESKENDRSNAHVKDFYSFCDMGAEKTPPQPDSEQLVKVASGSLPCRFFTREGLRISSMNQLIQLIQSTETKKTSHSDEMVCDQASDGRDLHLFAVPAGRKFMFAPKFVGEIFELSHVKDTSGKNLQLEVISVDPRVFDIINFFSMEEAEQLIDRAIHESSDIHGMHRSTTGSTGASIFSRRTSENAWDTDGPVAQQVKKRCMSTLGFDEYYESHTDGLQILRYNKTNAYVSHMDYLTDSPKEAYDFRSEGRGGNRFATVLMYMSDPSSGGETVFSKVESPGGALAPREVIHSLREAGQMDLIEKGSWEEQMVGTCRTKLSVRPQKARAVLFYSQFPNGVPDPKSFHGACPVLEGTKWAANLWVWNAARAEFDHAPFKFEQTKHNGNLPVLASFNNSGNDPKFANAKLWWKDQFFGDFSAGVNIKVNTFASHIWNVKDENGNNLQSFSIQHGSQEQGFNV